MYPDLRDVKLALRGMNLSPRPRPEDIWQDVVLVRGFLDESRGYCYNHGRHQFILVSELKKIVESFIRRSISDSALSVSTRMQSLQVKPSKKDGQSLVKMPPLERFEEVRDGWNQYQAELEKEIAEEIQHMESSRAWMARSEKISLSKQQSVAVLASNPKRR